MAGSSLQDLVMFRCALHCVLSACQLTATIHDATTDIWTGAWWYSIFYLNTCAVILILAEGNRELVHLVGQAQLQLAWSQCQETLRRMSFCQSSAGDTATTLERLREDLKHRMKNLGQSTQVGEDNNNSIHQNTNHLELQMTQPTSKSTSNRTPEFETTSQGANLSTNQASTGRGSAFLENYSFENLLDGIEVGFGDPNLPLTAMFYESEQRPPWR